MPIYWLRCGQRVLLVEVSGNLPPSSVLSALRNEFRRLSHYILGAFRHELAVVVAIPARSHRREVLADNIATPPKILNRAFVSFFLD